MSNNNNKLKTPQHEKSKGGDLSVLKLKKVMIGDESLNGQKDYYANSADAREKNYDYMKKDRELVL